MGAGESVRMLVMDVDGVLTDGSVLLDSEGRETNRFNTRDGLGLKVWRRLGLHAGVITGRSSPAVVHRMRELGVEHVLLGADDKAAGIHEISRASGVEPGAMAYIGDDWPDLAALRLVGYPIAVADAPEEVRAAAAHVTTRAGGRGAVREAIEHLLSLQGLLRQARSLYD
jgi:3-deoxy-D-manno-octulosonate 8-phosphate phosphatase (KDO 8-P phosphatase)